jgi:ribulose-phosphate 3-epimerase
LPHWEDLDFEFDLMVKDAYEKIPDFISAGASRIVVHKASVGEEELSSIIRDNGKHSDELGMFDVELGIALPVDGKPEDIVGIIDSIHFVQIMGIRKVGFQGQQFDAQAVETVRALRAAYPELVISVDGGVNLDTAPELIKAGASRLVVGSAIVGSDNVIEAIGQFKAL